MCIRDSVISALKSSNGKIAGLVKTLTEKPAQEAKVEEPATEEAKAKDETEKTEEQTSESESKDESE